MSDLWCRASVESLEARMLLSADLDYAYVLGKANVWETVASVATDAADNVYVAGTFQWTVDFDKGPGRKLVTSAGGSDIFIAKYRADGGFVWVRRIGGAGDESISEMTVDAAGNVYFAGVFSGSLDLNPREGVTTVRGDDRGDVYVGKLNADGLFQWGGAIHGARADTVAGLSVTPAGEVYLGGLFLLNADIDPGPGTLSVSSRDTAAVYLVKLSTSGKLLWHRVLQGDPENSHYVRISALTTGPTGELSVAGTFKGWIDFDGGPGTGWRQSEGGVNAYVLRLDGSGAFRWVDPMGDGGTIEPVAMRMDAAGAVAVYGQFRDSPDFNPSPATLRLTSSSGVDRFDDGDLYLQRISRSGKMYWVQQIGAPLARLQATDLTLDAAGNPTIAGAFQGVIDFDPGTGTAALVNLSTAESEELSVPIIIGGSAFVASYSVNGLFRDASQFAGDAAQSVVNGVTVDLSGAVYVVGIFSGTVDVDPGAGVRSIRAQEQGDGFLARLTS